MSDGEGVVDFVVAVYLADGSWQVESWPRRLGHDLDKIVELLRGLPGEAGASSFISVDEDFFVAVRVAGPEVRWLLSDVTAATDWPIARDVLERLSLPLPDDDDRVQPAGDMALFADYGVDPMSMAVICDDLDSYPDEMIARIAEAAGFGPAFDDLLEAP